MGYGRGEQPTITRPELSNAEEADKRIWRHATQTSAQCILVYSPHTDVYNIGLPIIQERWLSTECIVLLNTFHQHVAFISGNTLPGILETCYQIYCQKTLRKAFSHFCAALDPCILRNTCLLFCHCISSYPGRRGNCFSLRSQGYETSHCMGLKLLSHAKDTAKSVEERTQGLVFRNHVTQTFLQ